MSGSGFLKVCFVIGGLAMTLAVLAGHSSSALAQANFDRPGGDYTHSDVPTGDPAVCALTCERDRHCRAWSFNYPTTTNDNAVCWLKSNVPSRVQSTCCVSGVRGAGVVETRNKKLEIAIDRFGGDYRTMVVGSDTEGEPCRTACDADNKCRAWTYARPGYVGKDARCFLKDHIKQPRRKPGFISGVVR